MHTHISGMHGFTVFLYVVVVFGSLRLFAAAHPNSKFSQVWLALF